MLDYGQPLHRTIFLNAWCYYQCAPCQAIEQLKTLDGKDRTLTSDMLVIADAERAIGLAGVMGGKETEVTSTTTDIILEAAIFDPVSIRKTSRQLGLISEPRNASKRSVASLPSELACRRGVDHRVVWWSVDQGSVHTEQQRQPCGRLLWIRYIFLNVSE